MQVVYKIDTGHSKPICDFVVCPTLNVGITTSLDTDIRFYSLEGGNQIGEVLEGMECDHLAANGIHLLTRVGQGEAMIVWKINPHGGIDDSPLGEVGLDLNTSLVGEPEMF